MAIPTVLSSKAIPRRTEENTNKVLYFIHVIWTSEARKLDNIDCIFSSSSPQKLAAFLVWRTGDNVEAVRGSMGWLFAGLKSYFQTSDLH